MTDASFHPSVRPPQQKRPPQTRGTKRGAKNRLENHRPPKRKEREGVCFPGPPQNKEVCVVLKKVSYRMYICGIS